MNCTSGKQGLNLKKSNTQPTIYESFSAMEDSPSKSSVKSKRGSQWVSSSFDFDFNDKQGKVLNLANSKAQKRNLNCAFGKQSKAHQSSRRDEGSGPFVRRANIDNSVLWNDKHSPSSQDDLAVHKKKIQELENWLQSKLKAKKPAPVLLLTGPAGVGKTTTLKVIAKELKCEVKEWVNPVASAFDADSFMQNRQDYSRIGGSNYESQKDLFKDFLLRANKYRSLDIFGGEQFQTKLVLVEDYPNIFFRDPSSFQDIIQKYIYTGSSPLVFIISDSTCGNSNEKLLFPKEFQDNLNVDHISFNPVALTILTKLLTKIATKESLKGSHKLSVPSKTVLESIAMSSNGDIRGAVNALQFACLKETKDLVDTYSQKRASTLKSKSKSNSTIHSKSTSSKLKSSRETDSDVPALPCIGGKDGSLFLFRALGKILYCKRESEVSDSKQTPLPAHLSQHERLPLIEIPEEVVDKSHMSSELFSAFLQQNYVDFFQNIEDLERASECLSDADYITVDWATRSALQDYTVSIATRGLMHSNTTIGSKESGGRMNWRPLHKPEMFSVQRKVRDRCQITKEVFSIPIGGATSKVLHTEIIPYLTLTNTVMHSPRQISFVHELCNFPKFKSRSSNLERLEEGDVTSSNDLLKTLDNKEIPVTNSQSSDASDTSTTVPDDQDEEIIIEEFDD